MEKDYIILEEHSSNELEKVVNENYLIGYKPLGAPFVIPANDYSGTKLCQAMIYIK